MVENRIVFDTTVEALFVRALNGKLPPSAKDALKKAGLDVDSKLLPAYTFEQWKQFLAIGAKGAFPHLEPRMAHQALGRLLIDGYRNTFIGRALFPLLNLLGPRRGLDRLSRSFRSGNNYTETRFVEVGPNTYDLWMNETTEYPEFMQGILLEGTRDFKVDRFDVAVLEKNSDGVTFRISWKEKS
ncbi:MAG: DUF2378 family protein [Myxococcales bacterium]